MNARSLAPSPTSFVDPRTGEPAFGAYAGPLPRVDLPGLDLRARVARRKRWLYVALASDAVWISLGVVRTGYAATAFGFAYDLEARRMLVDETVLAPPTAARVADGPHEPGAVARFSFGKRAIVVARAGARLDVRARLDGLSVEAVVDDASAPPSVSAIARLGDGLVDATEKRALARVTGQARFGARAFDLSSAAAGWDYTHGLLPRHTRWHWAFSLGKTRAGEPIAFNLVEGFVGEAECAAFFDGRVHPLAEPRFEMDVDRPTLPWSLRGEGIDLRFSPGGVHAQRTNLVLVRSRFVQPVGTFEGRLTLDGRTLEVSGLPGVVEDQDVLW